MRIKKGRAINWLILALSAAGIAWIFGGQRINAAQLMGGPYKMMVYQRGRPIAEKVLPSDSPEAKLVARWLEAHDSGWGLDFVNYVPRHWFVGERFYLNLGRNFAALNYQLGDDPKRWIQVSRRIEPGDEPDVFGRPEAK